MTLTARQVEVINLIADGMTCKTIAIKWGIHYQTVKNHINEVKYKLSAQTIGHAVRLAIEQGYIDIGRLQ